MVNPAKRSDQFRTLNDDDRVFEGPSGIVYPINTEAAWCVYHLMRGGLEHRARLQRLVDWRRGSIEGVDLEALYLDCDNLWPHVDQTPTSLPVGRYVVCRNCRCGVSVVPCVRCSLRGLPVAWLADDIGLLPRGPQPKAQKRCW